MKTINNFLFAAEHVAGQQEIADVFLPVFTDRIICTIPVVKCDLFRGLGAEEQPAAAIPAFWECDNGIDHPSSPQSGKYRAHAHLPAPGFWWFKPEIFRRQTFPYISLDGRVSLCVPAAISSFVCFLSQSR